MPSNFRNMIKPLATAGSALQLAIRRDPSEMLSDRFFFMMLVLAMLLHLLAIGIWHLIPSSKVIDIPVRALNIKLGDGELMVEEKPAAAQIRANTVGVENTLSRLIREQSPEIQKREKSVVKSMEKAIVPTVPSKNAPSKKETKATGKPAFKAKEKKFDLRSEPNNIAAPVMEVTERQYVRETNPVVKVGGGIEGNSSSSAAEMISRYEQLISLWIQKFKVYPEEAKTGFMQGETVVRIRIDRRGNIRYYTLESSTGHDVLDHAAIDMIRRANPVPAVPNDYPPGDVLEFLIPVNFQLQ